MAKKIIIAVVVLCALLFAAGCGGDRTNYHERSYGNDGRLGTTQTNPNLQTSPTYRTYKQDQKLILDTLDEFEGIGKPRAVFNGATITIYYDVPKRYNWLEQEQLETRMMDALTYMLPRYEIRLSGRKK